LVEDNEANGIGDYYYAKEIEQDFNKNPNRPELVIILSCTSESIG